VRGHTPDPGAVREKLITTGNVLRYLPDDKIATFGELVCRDPNRQSPAIVAAGIQSSQPSIGDDALAFTFLLQQEYCPA
jgi:hypothetical protein